MPKRLPNNFTAVISAKAGNKENFTQVHFHVLPVNAHGPEFIFDHYEFFARPTIIERELETFLGQVKAYDPDLKEFGVITYSIISGKFF